MASTPILEPGKTCWRRVRARRLALLVDGESYYLALSKAIERARRSIWIVGWDIDSRTRLRRGDDYPDLEGALRSRLDAQPTLQVRILSWDFAMVYSLEREMAPLFRLRWHGHRRLHFRLDGCHPLGASQHQKIVVVDDALAFTGGLDLTTNRWDTSEHRPADPRRVGPDGRAYPPFHDVQVAVDGDAARALGELVRDRWRIATGEELPLERAEAQLDPWPPELEPGATDVVVGIARTFPAFRDRENVREVEALHLEAIRAARRSIYVENQYFTSRAIVDALVERLKEPDGPEVVMVMPRSCTGWLEEQTMGALRDHALRRLRDTNEERFRTYYPVVPDGGGTENEVFVHGKVLVVDERLARVGSANLSNRSLGLDSECDLALEALEPTSRSFVASFRNRLLAEHLGVKTEDVARAIEEERSLVGAVESLRGEGRSLRPIEPLEEALPQPIEHLADPERPIEADLLVEDFVEDGPQTRYWTGVSLVLLLLAGLAIAWRYSSLADWLTIERSSGWLLAVGDSPWAPIAAAGGYVVGTLVLVPLGLLILATAAAFDPVTAIAYSLLGTLSAGAVTFGLGHLFGRDLVRRLAGARLNRISKKLSRSGALTVASVRLVPLAPYAIVNLVAGATHLRFREFMLGTALGVLPGIVALTVFETTLEQAIRDSDPSSIATAVAVGVAVIGAGFLLQRSLLRK